MADIINFEDHRDGDKISVSPWVVGTDQTGKQYPIRPLTEEEWNNYWCEVRLRYSPGIEFTPEE